MNIQKIITLITVTAGLSIFSITAVHADPRKQQYVAQYESHHHQYKKKYSDRVRYRQARKIRHERKKRKVHFQLEIRNTLRATYPHKRLNYAKPHRKYDRRTYYSAQRNYRQYSSNDYSH